jgi:hypothetical protein
MRTQNAVFGVETKVNEHNKLVDSGQESEHQSFEFLPDPNERDLFLRYPLYNMPFYSGNKTPTMELVSDNTIFLTGSEVTYFTGSNVTLPIPQAEAEAMYRLERTHPPENFVRLDDSLLASDEIADRKLALATQDIHGKKLTFSDGNQLDISGRGMFLQLLESVEQSELEINDYDLEIFEIQESTTKGEKTETILIPLRFENDKGKIDELCVEHYFKTMFDDDVPDDYMRSPRETSGKMFNRSRKKRMKEAGQIGNQYANTRFENDLDCASDTQDTSGNNTGGGNGY